MGALAAIVYPGL
jgi:hypothetical protein